MRRRIGLALSFVLWILGAFPAHGEPVAVSGRIVDGDGRPVARASVELVPLADRFGRKEIQLRDRIDPEAVARTASRADGRFELAAPNPGMWQARVEARGFVPRLYSLVPLLEPTELPALEMVRDSPLRVRVLDPQGRPVAGARLQTQAPSSGPSGWSSPPQLVVARADGTAEVHRSRQGPIRISATAPGRPNASVDAEPSQQTVEVRLANACPRALRVTVQEKPDETPRPVEGALVTADGWTLGATDAAGDLTVAAPCDGDLRVEIATRDGRSAAATLRRSPAGAPPLAVRLPARPARMSGSTVEDGSRRPLAGVLVWPSEDPAAFAVTDAKGAYAIQASADSLRVDAAAAGYLPVQQPVAGGAGPTLLMKPAAMVSGTVVDEAGRAVADAVLRGVAEGRPGPRMPGRGRSAESPLARSGAEGRFQLRLVPGQPLTLTVTHPDFVTAKVPLGEIPPRMNRTGLQVVLQKGLSSFGKVVDAEGRPIAGAQVSLYPDTGQKDLFVSPFQQPPEASPPVATDAQGRFTIEHLEPGRFDLQAEARGFAPTRVPGIQLAKDQGAVDLGTVTLAPGVALEGRVVDPQDRPVAGAQVRVHSLSPLLQGRDRTLEEEPILSAADGSFSLSDLPRGESLMVFVDKTGYVTASLDNVEVPMPEPLRVVLKPGSKVSGRVVNEAGEPVAGAAVSLTQISTQLVGIRAMPEKPIGSARSDADGQFTAEEIEAGKAHLTAFARGFLEADLPPFEVETGRDVEGLQVVLRRGAVVTGRVTGTDGTAVAGARVQLVQGSGRRTPATYLGGATTDGDGNYRLEGVADGSQSFSAEIEGFQRAVRDLEVRSGENRLDFRLEPGHEVSGRVIDAAGEPVVGATVRLTPPGPARPRFFSTGELEARSGADGGFRIAGIATGTYAVEADKEGYVPARLPSLDVTGKVLGLELRLAAGGAIHGQLSGVEFGELPRVRIYAGPAEPGPDVVIRAGRVDFQGQYRIEGLSAGEWDVTAQTEDGRRAQGKVTVAQGSDATLDLEIGTGFTLSGRVLRAGEPVTDVFVSVQGAGVGGGGDQTDPQGAFRIGGLKAGTYDLQVIGFQSGINQSQTVEISADRELVVEISTRQVSGRVLDASDESPLGKVVLSLERLDASAPPRGLSLQKGSTSDADGAFTIADVSPGAYRLLAKLEGYASGETTIQVGSDADVENVRLALRPSQGLTVEVRQTVGGSPPEVRIALLDAAGRAVLTNTYPTGENGRVRISSAPPGSYRLLLTTGDSATVSQNVQVPGPPVRVVLPPGSSMVVSAPGSKGEAKVTVFGADGQPFLWLGYSGPMKEWPMFDGKTVIEGLPPGRWQVHATDKTGRTRQGVATTTAGGTAQAVLQ